MHREILVHILIEHDSTFLRKIMSNTKEIISLK